MTNQRVPHRGDIVWIDFQPQAGHEQAGRRPALVLSPDACNGKVGLALLCPVTRTRKGYPFEVGLPDSMTITGVALADQIKSLDWRSRQAVVECQVPPRILADVQARVRTLLGAT